MRGYRVMDHGSNAFFRKVVLRLLPIATEHGEDMEHTVSWRECERGVSDLGDISVCYLPSSVVVSVKIP